MWGKIVSKHSSRNRQNSAFFGLVARRDIATFLSLRGVYKIATSNNRPCTTNTR